MLILTNGGANDVDVMEKFYEFRPLLVYKTPLQWLYDWDGIV